MHLFLDNSLCSLKQLSFNSSSQPFLLGLFAITERNNKVQDKWVKCPTCRQHTDVGNIAYADDGQSETSTSSVLHTTERREMSEASVMVQGSYGTKVCVLLSSIL